MLAEGERTQPVFDEGNAPSLTAINALKNSIRAGLHQSGLIIVPSDIEQGAIAKSPSDVPTIQASDLAAGYAEDLYTADQGLRRVSEEFKMVILNGSLVQDWKQVERHDLDKLRTRT